MGSMWRSAIVSIVIVSFPVGARGQGNPVGPEFRVNSYTTQGQRLPSVERDPLGNFVVVWTSYGQDGSSDGIFGQRYDGSGVPLGAEFRVNTSTTGGQYLASVAAGSSGDFVVVWASVDQDGSQYGVFGQRYTVGGMPLGPEFRVNTYTTGTQRAPAIAADSSGSFVVAWMSAGQDGSSYGIFGQRFASSGVPTGPEFRVNTSTTGYQLLPSVAAGPAGTFVIVWTGVDGSNSGVFGQRYASSGTPTGPEFRVNTYTFGLQDHPSVALDSSGNFMLVWQSVPQDGSDHGVYGQRYTASGAPSGSEFRVNTYTTYVQQRPSVVTDSSGNFVVVWQSLYQDGPTFSVFGQRYAATGAPEGAEFRVNTFTNYYQSNPDVAADPAGNFVVVWQSILQDGSSFGVFGQRYAPIVPVELVHFRVE